MMTEACYAFHDEGRPGNIAPRAEIISPRWRDRLSVPSDKKYAEFARIQYKDRSTKFAAPISLKGLRCGVDMSPFGRQVVICLRTEFPIFRIETVNAQAIQDGFGA